MPDIDLGMNFAEAEEDAKRPVAPAGDYEFQIKGYELKEGGPNSKNPGRPLINWNLSILNADDPKLDGLGVFYNTSLPWTNPATGEIVDSGKSFITRLFQSVGATWEGSSFDPDAILGSTGRMKLKTELYEGEPQNKVATLYQQKQPA